LGKLFRAKLAKNAKKHQPDSGIPNFTCLFLSPAPPDGEHGGILVSKKFVSVGKLLTDPGY
jgi:hypothetical protein